MNKWTGIGIACFATGVLLPTVFTLRVLHTLAPPQEIEVVEETQEELAVSEVELFSVDYEQYGSMKIGDSFIRCDINNPSVNSKVCNVYIKDTETGEVITPEYTLHPADKVSVMTTSWNNDTVGKYNYTLVYDVQSSIIECPYVILLNKGGT